MDNQIYREAENIQRIIRALQAAQEELDLILLRTPTGVVRNQMTDGNTYLMEAVKALLEVA